MDKLSDGCARGLNAFHQGVETDSLICPSNLAKTLDISAVHVKAVIKAFDCLSREEEEAKLLAPVTVTPIRI
jgi:hypothetical protein